jgi:hypothetical protein
METESLKAVVEIFNMLGLQASHAFITWLVVNALVKVILAVIIVGGALIALTKIVAVFHAAEGWTRT